MTLNKIRKHEVLLYGLMNGLFYAWNAAFYGYMSTYFLACGMEASMLSTILAVYMCGCFLGALFWGRMCDRLGTNRKVFIFCFIGVMITASGSFVFASRNLLTASVLYIVMGTMLASLGANHDAWMLKVFHQDGAKYGRARAVGSMGYAVMMLMAGFLIQHYGYGMIQVLQLVTGGLCLGFAVVLPEEKYIRPQTEKKQGKGSIKTLLHSEMYMFLLMILFMTGLADSPVNNMKTVFMQDAGGDVSMLGIDSFLGVTLQAVLIFFSGYILKIPAKVRLLIVTLASLANMILVYTAVNPYMIMAGTLIWNVSFSFRLPTQRELTEKYTDPSVRNIAHSLSDAVVNNMAGILSLTYSGKLIAAFGCRSVAFTGMIIMSAASILLSANLVRKPKTKAKKVFHGELCSKNA